MKPCASNEEAKMNEAENPAAICVKCKHYEPRPHCEAWSEYIALIEWPHALAFWRDCSNGRIVAMDYICGEEIWSHACKVLNYDGKCVGFEAGPHLPRKVLVSTSCWYKPWTWGGFKWINEPEQKVT